MTVEDLITQNYSSTTGLFEVWGTTGDDKFIHQLKGDQSVTYNLGKGNDTLEFANVSESNKDDFNRYAVINSTAEVDTHHNVTNKDSVILSGYAVGGSGYQNNCAHPHLFQWAGLPAGYGHPG